MASGTRVGPGVAAAGGAAATAPEAERTDVPEGGRPTRKRVDRPEIDLDANIRDARETIQKAQAALTQARQQAKADRRKKARLIRKACHLSPADLERIAVLKRCGFSGSEQPAQAGAASGAAASSAAHGAQCVPAEAASSAASGTPHADAQLPAPGNASGVSPDALRDRGADDDDAAADSQLDDDGGDVAH